jgi:hypothetical protein
MAVVRGAFNHLLAPGARKVYVDEYNELPATYPDIFNVDTSGRAFEDDLVMTGLPIAVEKPEGEPIAFDRPRFRGRVRYIHAGYGLGYEITREAVEDDLYGAINSQGAVNLARSMREAEEITAWAIFNNAFSTTTAYDGVPLISTGHPGVGSITASNRPDPDEDLSVAALKSAIERFKRLTTDRGLKIRLRPQNLVVPIENWWTAQEILGAPYLSTGDQGQYTPNVSQQMGLTPFETAYLTDPDSWFLVADKASHSLKYYWRRQPSPEDGYDGRAQVSWFGITARWSAGVTDWRGIDGSPGT